MGAEEIRDKNEYQVKPDSCVCNFCNYQVI